jgi:plastocyanin
MSIHPSVGHALSLKRPLSILVALIGLIVGLFGAAPAQATGGSDSHVVTWKVLVGEETSDHAIQGMRFLPGEIWIDQGDSINFIANSAEIHTVSFGTPPLPPTTIDNLLADAVPPVGGPVFDPTAPWTNSGILTTMPTPDFPTVTSYVQKFTVQGSFTFWCLIHGQMMSLDVHVQKAHSKYPHRQPYYDHQAEEQSEQIIADGKDLWEDTADKASPTHVYIGASNSEVMVMRFIPSNVTVSQGSTVTFDMSANEVFVPHTVTFTNLVQNGQPVDSGILLGPVTFPVTFTQTGTWNYICQIHDEMGMFGSVKVS